MQSVDFVLINSSDFDRKDNHFCIYNHDDAYCVCGANGNTFSMINQKWTCNEQVIKEPCGEEN